MERKPEPFGFLVIDKPQGWTSHDIVAKIRRGIGVKRVGHAGTLDPMATGALVICIGAATRLSEYVMHTDKLYHACVRLGIETTTYDAEGDIVAEQAISHLTLPQIEAAVKHFQGDLLQIPPMYSAIKKNGQKLYDLARKGQTVELEPRPVHIFATNLFDYRTPDVFLSIWCSSGTYIRSIAHDLGAKLGVGGHLVMLHRRVVGSLNHLVNWAQFLDSMADGTWQDYLLSEQTALPHLPAVFLSTEQVADIQHGRAILREATHPQATLCRAYGPDDAFIAIVEAEDGSWRPKKVFNIVEQLNDD